MNVSGKKGAGLFQKQTGSIQYILLPQITAVPCLDWIDRVPRVLQYVPARLQEESFARAAAERVLRDHSGARVLSREAESARALLKKGHEDVFLEIMQREHA